MKSGQLQINELVTILNEHFRWNKARMACFVGMLISLLGVGTVNLAQFAMKLFSFMDADIYLSLDRTNWK